MNHAIPKSNLVITGDKWIIKSQTLYRPSVEITKGSFILSPESNPKKIDLKSKNLIAQGIYKVSGDVLTICLDPTGRAERPKDFDRCASDGYALTVYKRAK